MNGSIVIFTNSGPKKFCKAQEYEWILRYWNKRQRHSKLLPSAYALNRNWRLELENCKELVWTISFCSHACQIYCQPCCWSHYHCKCFPSFCGQKARTLILFCLPWKYKVHVAYQDHLGFFQSSVAWHWEGLLCWWQLCLSKLLPAITTSPFLKAKMLQSNSAC